MPYPGLLQRASGIPMQAEARPSLTQALFEYLCDRNAVTHKGSAKLCRQVCAPIVPAP
jgi:hypothetical protein